jgi:hypothetical protein
LPFLLPHFPLLFLSLSVKLFPLLQVPYLLLCSFLFFLPLPLPPHPLPIPSTPFLFPPSPSPSPSPPPPPYCPTLPPPFTSQRASDLETLCFCSFAPFTLSEGQ